jgi:trigger factor
MIADKKIKELENSSVELTVTVPAATVEEAYQNALKKYAQQIQIKGFRKGKAPVSVLRAVRQAIREESTFAAIADAVKEAIDTLEDKQKPLPNSTPALQDEDKLLPFQPNADVTFSVIYYVIPEVTQPSNTGLTVACRMSRSPTTGVPRNRQHRDQKLSSRDKTARRRRRNRHHRLSGARR